MKRKRVFLSLAIAPGLLIGGSRIIGSNSPDSAFDESRIEAEGAGDRLGNSAEMVQDTKKGVRPTRRRRRHHRQTTSKSAPETSTGKKGVKPK